MNSKKAQATIESFIRDKTDGFNGGVVGLSGGIDSAVVAYLAVNAIGKEGVYGLIMPYHRNENTDDAIKLADSLGIEHEEIDIRPLVLAFEQTGRFGQELPKENMMSRVRMVLLYGISNERNMLVLGTSNKSELMSGYFTKYGDGGVDIEPIGDLYKTEVWELAKSIGVPQKIIDKVPSADLHDGQTDESDIGMDYPILDRLLQGQTTGIDPSKIEIVKDLVEISEHKRKMPPVAVIER